MAVRLSVFRGSRVFLARLLLFGFFFPFLSHVAWAEISSHKLEWRSLASGLDFGEFSLPDATGDVTVLRINPEDFDFVLCSAGQTGGSPATLKDWVESNHLVAAINASMYLPDNSTSTGYMRFGDYVNNGHIVGRFGGFLVAMPRKEGIPRARIVDKDEVNWRRTLEDYDLVIQNYRMTNAQRCVLWAPGGPLYAISAIAQDADGHILFLHCRRPIDAHAFVQGLLALPLHIRTMMYVEGGAQAGMVISAGGIKRDLGSLHAPSLLITGNFRALLPNVLGIRPREK